MTYPFAEINGYKVINNGQGTNQAGPTWTLKMLITGALTSHFSVDAGDLLMSGQEFNHEDDGYQIRSLIRGVIKKMPYFYFSDYQTVIARPSFLVSEL